MSDTDQRHIARDSLFMMAGIRLAGDDHEFKVKVRNLSAGGLMAEGGPRVVRGTPVTVDLRNIGQVSGSVAWVQETRFGIAFDEDIDPKAARVSSGEGVEQVPYRPAYAATAQQQASRKALRKI